MCEVKNGFNIITSKVKVMQSVGMFRTSLKIGFVDVEVDNYAYLNQVGDERAL